MAPFISSSIPKSTSTIPPFCTFIFILTLCILSLYTLYNHHPPPPTTTNSRQYPPFVSSFLNSASNYTISTYLRHLTLHPHLSGTPPSSDTADYVKTHFRSLRLDTQVTNYSVLLSYHIHSSLTAQFSTSSSSSSSSAAIPLPLSEPGSAANGVVKPYHAYSPSGSAYGKAVYVHHGRDEDYRALAAAGVEVKGCIAVAKRGGGMSRNAVVVKAAEKGLVAVLMYTDSNEKGRIFSGGGVERGTVLDGLGDPLTPGWAAVVGGERLGVDDGEVVRRFPTVPSMPISAETAMSILGSLKGAFMPHEWRIPGKFDRVGPGPTFLNFTYQGENKVATIQNVFAVIKGSEEPDRFVILGNHRDAWTYGAVDPNSGTASLLDIARRYALMMRLGWKPKRTIVLCSWDAEEFGMIGSTEWVEQNLVNLQSKAVAYLNMDCAVQGPGFFAGTTPQLDDILVEVTKKVLDPDFLDSTLFEKWTTSNQGVVIQRLGDVFSDYAPFLHHAGVPSVDLYYGRDFPVYHTAFDSYDWMVKYGDPLFQRHVAVANVWGLLGHYLADEPILPFNYLSYAVQLQKYVHSLNELLEGNISLQPIVSAVQELETSAKQVESEMQKLMSEGEFSVLKRRLLNDRLMFAERGFLDSEGISGRPFFKHLVYGPASEGKLGFFPGIVDAIYQSSGIEEKKRQAVIQHEIWRAARAIQRAASALTGDLN